MDRNKKGYVYASIDGNEIEILRTFSDDKNNELRLSMKMFSPYMMITWKIIKIYKVCG